MKKLLLFFALFGFGLGVLWWLESKTVKAPLEGPPPLTIQPASVAPEAPTQEATQQHEPGLSISGAVEVRLYNDDNDKKGLIKLEMVCKSSETIDGIDRLGDVNLDLYDSVSSGAKTQKRKIGSVQALTAEISRLQSNLLKVEYEHLIRMNQLSAQLSGEKDLSDLTFNSPSGVVDLTDEFQTLFLMREQINLKSKELRASGTGATITVLNSEEEDRRKDTVQFIEIERDARLEFQYAHKSKLDTPKETTLVEVKSEGSMSLYRIDRSESKSRTFEAWDQAHMLLSGAQSSDLEADHLQFRVHGSDHGDELVLEHVTANGDAVWKFLSHSMRGQNIELGAGEQGELSAASVTGFPQVLLNLIIDESKLNYLQRHTPKRKAKDLLPSQVSLSSESKIEMKREAGRVELTLKGPAIAESKSFVLRSVGDLVISIPDEANGETIKSGLVHLEASGGVIMELLANEAQPYSKLETAALSLSLIYAEDDSNLDFFITTEGGAKIDGYLRDGRSLTVDTPRSLKLNRHNGELQIKEAFDVALNIEAIAGAEAGSPEATSYLANCKHLIQFVASTQKLEADQGVSLTNNLGSFTCDRIKTLGSNFAELWGNQSQQVSLTSNFGIAHADQITVSDSSFLIQGNVRASLVGLPDKTKGQDDLKLERLDVHCEELEIQLLETQLQRITECAASGNVFCELVGEQRSLELHHSDQLNLLKTDWFASQEKSGEVLRSSLHIDANGSVYAHASLGTSRFELWCDQIDVDPLAEGSENAPADVIAQGAVRFNGSWRRAVPALNDPLSKAGEEIEKIDSIAFAGEGNLLEIFANSSARLGAKNGEVVKLSGALPLKSTNFNLVATEVQFGPEKLDAANPVIRVLPDDYRLSAERLVADRTSIDIHGRTRVSGKTEKGKPWELAADKVELHDLDPERTDSAGQSLTPGLLTVIEATGNVHFKLDDKIEAFADVLRRNALGISLSGDPCKIITHKQGGPSTVGSSTRINFDIELEVITEMGRGQITSLQAGDGGPISQAQEEELWSLKFLSFKTEFDQDSILFFMEEPIFTKQTLGEKLTLRSSYSLVWVPKEKWKDINSLGGKRPEASDDELNVHGTGSMDVFFEFIRSQRIADAVDEVYFEGPVETYRNDQLISHADAVYLDLRTGHGWLTGVTLNIIGSFLGSEDEQVTVRADWLRHSKDGSLTADKATITTCDYAEAHIRVVTGELKLKPLIDAEEPGYSVSIRDNGIEVNGLFTLPLPPLEFNTDEKLRPKFPSFSFGNSTRFGQLLSVNFSQPATRLGRFFHGLFGGGSKDSEQTDPGAPKTKRPAKPYKAKYDIDASYLSSRGGLVDLGFSIEEKEDRYWLEWINGVVLDNGRDRGYIRLPKRDRGRLRFWLRSQGLFQFDRSSLGFSYSDQSDPAVQSEFFESDFTRYEQDETYLQWKGKRNNYWYQSSVQVRVDEFRAGVEELPSATVFRGKAPLFSLGAVDIIHSGEFNAAYLRRLTPSRFDLDNDGLSESVLTSPFASDGQYADGLGAQDVFRTHTRQVLEAPQNLGFGGLRFTPFATFFGMYWDNAIDQSYAARLVGDVGARLSTVLWKRNRDGSLHQFSPFIEYRNDVVNKVDGNPLDIDATERALFGNFIQVGTRSRFDVQDDRSLFDFDIKGIYASGRSDGGANGWLPIEVYSRLGINPLGRRLDVWYDGRFDAERGEPLYSHFSLGTRVADDYGAQIGYTYGRDQNLVKLFDTASISGFYRWTDKWEFEARQSFSLLENRQLGFEMVLRRYGHDLIFELESKLREGEGSAIGFSVRPRLGFKPNRIGYTNW